ncbi:MAG: alpha/beta hydrolase [Gammaproteobacteria bacterium]
MESFPSTETTFLLPSPAGNLEVIATPAEESHRQSITAIICHPHPLFGGTMNNKVVTTLARTFRELGIATVRFNFRGVGKSTGSHADGVGEVDDLLTVVEWVKKMCPENKLWLAGFSFGGYIAARVATQIPIAQLVTIAPQVSRFTSGEFPPITVPWVLVQGEEDDVISPQEVYAWIETLEHKPVLIRIPGAGHFFHGKLLELRDQLVQALQKNR